jgi:AraC-like DNA-binding protein
MKKYIYHERQNRGTFDFPIEFHHVNSTHSRYQMPFHWHIEYELLMIISGEFQLFIEETSINMKAGDTILISDGAVHGGIPKDCVYECIVFDFSRFIEDSTLCGKEIQNILSHNVKINECYQKGSELNNLIKILFETMSEAYNGYEFVVKGILFQMIGLIIRHKLYEQRDISEVNASKRIINFKKVLQKIRLDYEKPLTLEELARVIGTSPKYFCRFFKEMSGRSPIDYLNYYRVECAAEQLLITSESVTEIAFSCGFNDLSYFIKTFHKYKGTSPRAFRKADVNQISPESF